MAKSSFNLNEKKEGIIILNLPIFFRIASLFVAVLLSLTLIIPDGPTENLWIPILIICITLLASLYQEQWIFDKNKRVVTYAFGLLFYTIKKRYDFDKVTGLYITGKKTFTEPKRFRAMQKSGVKMSISMEDGTYKMIDLTTNKADIEIMEKKAEHISAFCNFELIKD